MGDRPLLLGVSLAGLGDRIVIGRSTSLFGRSAITFGRFPSWIGRSHRDWAIHLTFRAIGHYFWAFP
ncbi:hypothetical protein [Ammoniphilus sp. YIM 78166]|uniref:hypothetical protein n=1 Tax=Ammoniphilus sp. YIM 78166 TaxID=1644106 RepID=UPI00142FF141|nr:hypothetical protein [Ammoniphilus sp. YIM 78166]